MVPNKPNMTTIICRKFPRIGAHWKPRKSKICLSNAESYNKAEREAVSSSAKPKHTVLIFISQLEKSAYSISTSLMDIIIHVMPILSMFYATSLSKYAKITVCIMTANIHWF